MRNPEDFSYLREGTSWSKMEHFLVYVNNDQLSERVIFRNENWEVGILLNFSLSYSSSTAQDFIVIQKEIQLFDENVQFSFLEEFDLRTFHLVHF